MSPVGVEHEARFAASLRPAGDGNVSSKAYAVTAATRFSIHAARRCTA